jgi:hypothetical protein
MSELRNRRDTRPLIRYLILSTRCAASAAVVLLVAAFNSDFSGAAAKDKKKVEAYCLLVGSCFNERGFSLPGVTVVVEVKPESGQTGTKKKWELVSSPRGEFAVRLPAGKGFWLVTAKKKGYRPMERTVEFADDERHDVIFNMEPLGEPKQ